MDFQIPENRAVEIAEHLVVIAGDENDLRAALGLAENRAQYIDVRLRPVHGLLHAPDVDDVADQEQVFHLDVMQIVEQQLGAATLESQMYVGDEDRADFQRRVTLALNHMCSSDASPFVWQHANRL
jgi:hypothetical protein